MKKCAFKLLLTLMAIVICVTPAAAMSISSSSFKDNGGLPVKYVYNDSGMYPAGKNISPQLAWDGAPSGTKRFVLIMRDVSEVNGGMVHWALSLPLGVTALDEDVDLSKIAAASFADVADYNKTATYAKNGYCGPFPPKEDPAHKYTFTIYALASYAVNIKDLEDEANTEGVISALDSSSLASSSITCYYPAKPGSGGTTPGAEGSSDILVIKGPFDRIEKILDNLGLEYSLKDVDALSGNLSGVKQLYITCNYYEGLDESYFKRVKEFVEKGGHLYVSDLACDFVAPWGLEFEKNGRSGVVSADVIDPGLKSYIGTDSVEIEYNFGGWARITNSADAELVMSAKEIKYGSKTQKNAPIVVQLHPGEGSVLYTTFHDAVQIVEYFAITPLKEVAVKALLAKYGIEYANMLSSSASKLSQVKKGALAVEGAQNVKGGYLIKITDVKLAAEGRAAPGAAKSCEVSLYAPDGKLYKTTLLDEDGTACVNVGAGENAKGEWLFKINASEGYTDNLLVVAASAKDSAPTPPSPSGSSGGGCNAGIPSLALLLAAAAIFMKKSSRK